MSGRAAGDRVNDLTATRVRIVVEEIEQGRIENSRPSIVGFVRHAFTLPEEERRRIVTGVLRTVERESRREERKLSEPKGVLRGKEVVPVAAKVYRKHPGWTHRQVYQQVLADGYRIEMSADSFGNNHGKAARDMASVKNPPAVKSEEVCEDPVQESPTPEPAPEAETQDPAQAITGNITEPVAMTKPRPEEDTALAGTNGDRILLELGGRRFEARRAGDEWDVEFEGSVGGELMGELVRRVLAGVGS